MKKKMNVLLAAIMSIQAGSGLAAPVFANENEEPVKSAETETADALTSEAAEDKTAETVGQEADSTEEGENSEQSDKPVKTEISDGIEDVPTVNSVSFGVKLEFRLNYKSGDEIVKSHKLIFGEADKNEDGYIDDSELSSDFLWGIPEGYQLDAGNYLEVNDLFNMEEDEKEIDLQIFKAHPDVDGLADSRFLLCTDIYSGGTGTRYAKVIWKDVDLNLDGFISFEELRSQLDTVGDLDLNDLQGYRFENPDRVYSVFGGLIQRAKLIPDLEDASVLERMNAECTLTFTNDQWECPDPVSFVWKDADEDNDPRFLTAKELNKYLPEGYSYRDPEETIDLFGVNEDRTISIKTVPSSRQNELMNSTYSISFTDQSSLTRVGTEEFVWKDVDLDQNTYITSDELVGLLPEEFYFFGDQWKNDYRHMDLYGSFDQGMYVYKDRYNYSLNFEFQENGDLVGTESILWKDYDGDRNGLLSDEELRSLLPDGYLFKDSGALMDFNQEEPYIVSVVKTSQEPEKRPVDQFVDIPEDHWGREVINEAVEKGIMVGLDDEHFGPSEPMSRAMAVTVLWRLAGTPETAYKNSFTDIQDDLWYTKAVNWAVENNVVHGMTDTTFEPDTNINREQLAVMITNYLHSRGMSLETDQSLDQFKDKDEVSSFAETSMKFVVKHGIMSGAENGTMLMPKKDTERAEAAKMFLLTSKLH